MIRSRKAIPSAKLRSSNKDRAPCVSSVNGKSLPFSMLVCLVGTVVIFLVPFWFMAEDIRAPKDLESQVPSQIKKMTSRDLRTMLSSANTIERAYAVQELGRRVDRAVETQLIGLLTDFSPVQLGGGSKKTRLAELSRTALFRIIWERIWSNPDDVGLLIPYFKIARTGSLYERTAIIEILGALKEPMAKQLLAEMASDPNPLIRQAATDALANFSVEKTEVSAYAILWRIDVILGVGLAVLIGCALWATAKLLFDRVNLRIGLLSIIPIVLLGWIAWLVVLDFSMGIADGRAIDSAIRHRDLLALKAMNYHDFTVYPADSYVAQHLVRVGTEEAVRCLALLPTAGLDDRQRYVGIMNIRYRWALSRIIGTRLGTPDLQEMAASTIPEVRATIAEYLGRLRVKNQVIIDTLTHLSNDENEEVRKKAAEALAKAQRSPVL